MKGINTRRVKDTIRDSTEPRNMRTIAVAFWRSLIFIGCVVCAFSVLYGIWMFQDSLQQLEDAEAPPSAARVAFKREDFDATVQTFANRELQYQVTEAAPPVVVDPK